MSSVTMNVNDPETIQQRVEHTISEHKNWYIFQSIVFMIAGILAIFLPSVTAVGFELLIGALLLVSGGVQMIASFRSRVHWWALISGAASVAVGLLMLFNPMAGTIALATVLAIFLAIEGVTEVFLAFQFKPAKNWGWLLFSGAITLLLSVLLFAGWPGATVFFLGIIIGINLLLYGIALFALTRQVKRAS